MNLVNLDVSTVLHLSFVTSVLLDIDFIKVGVTCNVLEIFSLYTRDIIINFWDRFVKDVQVNILQTAKLVELIHVRNARTICICTETVIRQYQQLRLMELW